MSLTGLVLATFAFAPLVALLARTRFVAAVTILPAVLFLCFIQLLPNVLAGKDIVEQYPWIPSFGVTLTFRADALSLLFALLITGIGSCVYLYASSYMSGRAHVPAFFAYLTLFMGSMLGAVLADNLIVLLVFWELTSLTSFLLIGFEHEKSQARRSAQQSLLVTVGGGLALTAGILLLGNAAGSLSLSELLRQDLVELSQTFVPAIILLVALAAFTKSAQTPFHFWLPNAMVAPTPVSAYLHSATMVKLGIYLLARFNPLFRDHPLWEALLLAVGLTTMVTSAVLLLRETDLKRILAHSTIAALGTMVMLIGIPHPLAAVALVTLVIAHALYKACLFLVAGIIDHEAGTRDASQVGGLAKRMPVTATMAMLGGLSMAGIPLLVGFLSKELMYEAGALSPWRAYVLGISLLTNAATMVAAGVIAVRSFWGPILPTPRSPHDPPLAMSVGPAALASCGLLFGCAPTFLEKLAGPVAEAVQGAPVAIHLSLWHGLTPIVGLTITTWVAGIALYWCWNPLRVWLRSKHAMDQYGPNAIYDRCLVGLVLIANWQTRLLQCGRLHTYLAATITTVTLAVGISLVADGRLLQVTLPRFRLDPMIVLPILLILAAISVVRAGSFMAGLVAAAMVGFLMAMVFLFQGAPDLAFTQFSMEALSIVILLTIVGRMPFHETEYRTIGQRRRDFVIALAFGTLAAVMLLVIVDIPFDDKLSSYYNAASVPEAHGRNVVNVVIVDFRALDTLGEITVLALAAIAVSVLVGRRIPSVPTGKGAHLNRPREET